MSISARDRWQSATTVPLALLGVAFIVFYSVWVLADLSDELQFISFIVVIVVWVVFTIDLVVRLAMTPRGARTSYAWKNPLDVLAVGLPVFRALHVAALVQRGPFFAERIGNAVRARAITFMVLYGGVFVWFLAIATLHAERTAPGSTITSLGDAIWWAAVTIFTVGYGDVVPVTVQGRVYGILLMIGGVAIIATASAVVVSWITERVKQHSEEPPA